MSVEPYNTELKIGAINLHIVIKALQFTQAQHAVEELL